MTKIVSKPDYGSLIAGDFPLTHVFQLFFDDLEQKLNDRLLGNQIVLESYTVANLPPVVEAGLIYVSDETGGAVPAFSDGTNWRRVTDRAIVS